ncbi:four helix bundle protein [candidate division WOR-3 bacterium]|nr:four helix bundle protein [candidate division WOR-3 bacterium]
MKKKVRKKVDRVSDSRLIAHFRDLDVYKRAFALAMRVFEITRAFPAEERYSLVDQIRRSSRSVCSNIACPV